MKTIVLKGSPKSVNHTYLRSKNGRMYMAKEAKEAKDAYGIQARMQWNLPIITTGVQYYMRVYFKDNRKRDLDNVIKAIQDSLSGIVWEDDSLVNKLTVERFVDKENPRIEIDIL